VYETLGPDFRRDERDGGPLAVARLVSVARVVRRTGRGAALLTMSA
jgi:hypothetical protein